MSDRDARIVWGALWAMAENDRLPASISDLQNGIFRAWSEELLRECFESLAEGGKVDLDNVGKVVAVYTDAGVEVGE